MKVSEGLEFTDRNGCVWIAADPLRASAALGEGPALVLEDSQGRVVPFAAVLDLFGIDQDGDRVLLTRAKR